MNAAASADIATVSVTRSAAWEIPRLTARLLWNHWPALLFWFFAMRLSYSLSMDAAIWLAETSVLLSFAAIAVLIVTQLAGTIAMFLSLRPSLPMLASRDAAIRDHAQRPWIHALAIALLPFFAYYATWGLLEGVKRDFRLQYMFGIWYEQQEAVGDILSLRGLWIALLAAWAIRHVSKRRAESTGHAAWLVLATACEAYWVFVGVAAIAKAIGVVKDWWHARAVYVAVADWWENPLAFYQLLPSMKRVLVPAWDFISTAGGAVLLPLIWLAITAIVYGLDLRRANRIDDADTHLDTLSKRYKGMPLLVRTFTDKASAGWTSKGVPVVNSIRLVLRAGLPALLTLCVCWQLLAFIDAWAWRVAVETIGARESAWWDVIGQPIALLFNGPLSIRPALFTELIRVALLAATFGVAVSRLPRSDGAATSAVPATG